MIFNKNSNKWEYLGKPGLSRRVADGQLQIAPDGTLYLVMTEYDTRGSSEPITFSVMTYNQTTKQWQYLAHNGIKDINNLRKLKVAPDGNLYIALKEDNGQTSVMTYNKNNQTWGYVGSPGIGEIINGSGELHIAPDNSLYLIMEEFFDQGLHYGLYSILTYDKNSNQWKYISPRGFIRNKTSDVGYLTISPTGSIYFAFGDLNRSCVSVMIYNKNNNQWSYIGHMGFAETNNNEYNQLKTTPDGNIYFAFRDHYTNDQMISVVTYNKNKEEWEYLRQSGFIEHYGFSSLSTIAPDNSLYFTNSLGVNPAIMTYNKKSNTWQKLNTPTVLKAFTTTVDSNNALYLAYTEPTYYGKTTVIAYY